ncbi:MAG: EF-P lysine aminoacylase GenX [Methylococcaceae bacterium]|nr:EF-P lysine aminoacylase GenX [Methylococcaceae bacterium]
MTQNSTLWQPSCSIELLEKRARMLNCIRTFFLERNVLEVETPLLSHTCGTEPQLDFFTSIFEFIKPEKLFLQTSPEFAMKRLLAAGSGSIYQICKAFRNNEVGRFHNPEFTILEWYRVGFDLNDLMDEVEALFAELSEYKFESPKRIFYAEIFEHYTGLNALVFSFETYSAFAIQHEIHEAITFCGKNHAIWLDYLFSFFVQSHLGENGLCLIYGYPACQSALARLNPDNSLVADRFEVFLNGIELGNGFYELSDSIEQNRRFNNEIQLREREDLPKVVKDKRLLAALKSGLPDCSGIAIGLDRLLMILVEAETISDVLSFDIERA